MPQGGVRETSLTNRLDVTAERLGLFVGDFAGLIFSEGQQKRRQDIEMQRPSRRSVAGRVLISRKDEEP